MAGPQADVALGRPTQTAGIAGQALPSESGRATAFQTATVGEARAAAQTSSRVAEEGVAATPTPTKASRLKGLPISLSPAVTAGLREGSVCRAAQKASRPFTAVAAREHAREAAITESSEEELTTRFARPAS